MIFNKNLAIVVPTYNREQILRVWFESHAQLLFSKKIRIHIQDNNSTDGTKKLLKEWKKRFKNISFAINKKNLLNKNCEIAINSLDAKFIWTVGDTYAFDIEIINKIISIIKKRFPLFILINLKGRVKKIEEKYVSANFVCQKLSGIMSCISCIIYNKAKLKKIIFREFLWSSFPHTIYLLNQLKLKNQKAYLVPLSVNSLKLKTPHNNWSTTSDVFKIGCKGWIDSIDSLSNFSVISKKKAYRLFSDATNLFSWKGGLWLRSQGLLTIDKIKDYKIYLNKSVGKKYFILYFIALLPIFPLKVLRIMYQCSKK